MGSGIAASPAHRSCARSFTPLALGRLLCGAVLLMLAACAAPGALKPAQGGGTAVLPALPDDGPAYTRRVSAQSALDGSEYYDANDTSGTYIHPYSASLPSVLTIDATSLPESSFLWVVWRLKLSSETVLEELRLDTYQSGMSKYYAGLADYAQQLWNFGDIKNPDDLLHYGSFTFPLPTDESDLHSPGEYCYAAVVVMGGVKVNIQSLTTTVSGGSSTAPIFDQYEPNDPMETPWTALPGYYHASIHETYIPEMGGRDKFDFYRIHVGAGQHLTAALRYEPYDHFWSYSEAFPFPNYNDLDVLIYPPGSTRPYDDFIESASGLTIYYYAADQGYLHADTEGDYLVGILGEIDGPDNNAEYYLTLNVSDAAYTVSGQITQQGIEPSQQFLVFLDSGEAQNPGNYNAVATIDAPPHGQFSIRGVPDGNYTLKVQSSAALIPYPTHPYIWPETLPVTVTGADVSGLTLDIGANP